MVLTGIFMEGFRSVLAVDDFDQRTNKHWGVRLHFFTYEIMKLEEEWDLKKMERRRMGQKIKDNIYNMWTTARTMNENSPKTEGNFNIIPEKYKVTRQSVRDHIVRS